MAALPRRHAPPAAAQAAGAPAGTSGATRVTLSTATARTGAAPAAGRSGGGAPAAAPLATPADRAQALIGVLDRLTTLLGHELDAIRSGRLETITALQAEKRSLAVRLDEGGRVLRLDQGGIAALPDPVRTRLSEAARRLQAMTDTSADTLAVQAQAQQTVVDVVVTSVNRERRADAAYAQASRGFVPAKARLASGGSMTLNSRV